MRLGEAGRQQRGAQGGHRHAESGRGATSPAGPRHPRAAGRDSALPAPGGCGFRLPSGAGCAWEGGGRWQHVAAESGPGTAGPSSPPVPEKAGAGLGAVHAGAGSGSHAEVTPGPGTGGSCTESGTAGGAPRPLCGARSDPQREASAPESRRSHTGSWG